MKKSGTGIVGLMLLLGLLAVGPTQAQDTRTRLFKQADDALAEADSKHANVLAPEAYSSGMREYQSGERKFDQGKSVDSIQDDLSDATEDFNKAVFIAELAAQKLAPMIKARADAVGVDAKSQSARSWQRAEAYYVDAVSMLEDGRQNRAIDRMNDAIPIYRELELEAIKAQYLTETRTLIEQAEDIKAKRYAPITLQKAKYLLAEAEKELTENRYDADKPRSLAREANYEARHAIFLARYLAEVRGAKMTEEQLVLQWEEPLKEIAAAADIQAQFDEGYGPVTGQLTSVIETQLAAAQETQQLLEDRDAVIASLTEQVGSLSEQLGGLSNDQEAMAQRLAAQEELRQKVKQIEGTFDRPEAQVFRDSNEIYIRVVGLSFGVGSADIKADNYPLLAKVENAIDVFPGSDVIIEGHTDSFGSDDTNMILSEARAESVRQYLLVQMSMAPDKISAVGYGETNPVANNETPQGRAKNRRIDVRIVPNLDLSTT